MNKYHQLMMSRFPQVPIPTRSLVTALLRCIVVTLLLVSVGCQSSASVGETQQNSQSKPKDKMNTVIQDVRTFARDEGKPGEEAWARLSAYPRTELIDSLRKIQQDSNDESLSIDVAFVLCNLNHEYEPNRQVIVSAFTKAKGDAFSEERLIDRLIQRGDKDLLPVLFSAAQYSDGALSEALADSFARQLRKDPEQFFTQLSAESRSSRQQIYKVLIASLSPDDTKRIKEAVSTYPEKPAIRKTAEELLHAMRSFRH